MKKTFIGYILVCTLLLTDLILNLRFNITLAGYYSDRILFWIWLTYTLMVIILFWRKTLTKIYFGIFIIGIVLSMIPMGIIFFGAYLSISGKGLIFEKKLTSKYRLQVTSYSIMTKYSPIEIIENHGIFEKEIIKDESDLKINDSLSITNWDIKNVRFVSENDKEIVLKITDGKNRIIKSFKKKKKKNYYLKKKILIKKKIIKKIKKKKKKKKKNLKKKKKKNYYR